MSQDYKAVVDALNNEFNSAGTEVYYGRSNISQAQGYLDEPNLPYAISHCIQALTRIYDATSFIIGFEFSEWGTYSLMKCFWRSWQYDIENRDKLPWVFIVESWIENDFAGREWTIACIDRMRQILWDEPFNIMFAARPEETKGEV